MDYAYLAQLLFPNVTATPEEMEARYPARDLPEGAKVTRFAPSPTGFVHLGGLYGATIDERLADGYYYSKSVRLLKHLLQNPELLELPANTPVEYSIKK